MTERKFDGILTTALLAFSAVYCVIMFLYPAQAGRVPGIVALVAIGALLLQLLLSLRSRSTSGRTADEPAVVSAVQAGLANADAPISAGNEPEPDNFYTLLAFRGGRLRRLLTIFGFILAFYVGATLVGFVVTPTVLMVAILLMARERVRVALIGGAVAAVSSYLLVVQLLGLPLIQGYLAVGG